MVDDENQPRPLLQRQHLGVAQVGAERLERRRISGGAARRAGSASEIPLQRLIDSNPLSISRPASAAHQLARGSTIARFKDTLPLIRAAPWWSAPVSRG